MPWPSLNKHLNLATQELSIVAGAPGSGKSTWAINFALRARVPVLYLTQDSPASVFVRMAALTLDSPTALIRQRLQEGGMVADSVRAQVRQAMPADLVVDGGRRTIAEIGHRIVAMQEVWGHSPHVVVVDNLIDLDVEGKHHQETGFYAEALTKLKATALHYDVNIMALHHVLKSGEKGLGTQPITMGDLLHGGEREARHVLGIYHEEDQRRMWVQILKAQDGRASPEGNFKIPLRWLPEMGSLVE